MKKLATTIPYARAKTDKLMQRWGALKTERSSWLDQWRDLGKYLQPRLGRWLTSDRNKGDKRHGDIYDSTGTRSCETLASGLMAGATSPARPWFRLATRDPELSKNHDVGLWLADAAKRVAFAFQRSNTYRALGQVYLEIATFGTAATLVMPDRDTVIHHHPLTVGEFAIQKNYRGEIVTLFREFDLTVGEIVGEWGIDAVSPHVKNLFTRGMLDAYVTLCHAIEPRADRDASSPTNKNKRWASCYFETGERGYLLDESGFDRFPALVPRWMVSGGDVYGNGPGMAALPFVKQLNLMQLRRAESINAKTKPPLLLPTSMQNREIDMLPGGMTFADVTGAGDSIRSLYEVGTDLADLREDIVDVRQQIDATFFADLFRMLSLQPSNGRMTATEIAERHEEKLLMLGPVLERLHNELLEPLVDMTFERLLLGGGLLPLPEALQGQDLTVEFVSMLAQAQKAVATNGVDRFVANLGAIAQAKPELWDKFDTDEWADSYADMLGVDPRMIVATEKAGMVRKARDDAMRAKEQSAMMVEQAKAARDLAAAPTDTQNALTDAVGMFSGYSTPGV